MVELLFYYQVVNCIVIKLFVMNFHEVRLVVKVAQYFFPTKFCWLNRYNRAV